jgi:hypothetical protein
MNQKRFIFNACPFSPIDKNDAETECNNEYWWGFCNAMRQTQPPDPILRQNNSQASNPS